MMIAEEAAITLDAPYPLPNPFRESFRVAIFARFGDFDAAPPGIEGVVRPFNLRVLTHQITPVNQTSSIAQNGEPDA